MTDRYGSYPPDEPVIGGSYPPPGRPISTQGEGYIGAQPPFEEEEGSWDGDDDDDQYDDDGYYDDAYDGETPARQPMFYVFIGLAALIGGIIIVLLFSLVNSSGGGNDPKGATAFKVFVDSPTPNKRIEIGKPEDVIVRAKASEAITRFELFVGDQSVDSVSVTKPPAGDDTYSATLRLPGFDRKGNNQIFVRVTSASGEHKDSDKITVIAIEPVGAKPQFVKGKVVADATVREGPGDNFPVVKTLTAGTEVNILGRTRDSDWLLIDIDGGRWVKRNAIAEQDSLSLVPLKDPTPVPAPSATNTAVPSPSPSVSPTANAKLPDFVPQNATLTDGGAKLRVTVGNASNNSYTGPLVVSVSGVNPGTLSLAFSVNLPANGSATVEFDLNPAVTTQKTATIKVDPDNAIKEANEDNNRVDFGLTPAAAQPDLVITLPVDLAASPIAIGIRNNGGALPASDVTVRITVGGAKTELTKNLALAKGQDASFTVAKPGSGAGKVEVLIGVTVVASQNVPLP